MRMFIVVVLLALSVNAHSQSQTQIDAACAGALLFVASHQSTSQTDKNRYSAAGFKFLSRLPAHLHDAVDVAIYQFAAVPYSQAKQAANQCIRML